jgi:hypothetical protein
MKEFLDIQTQIIKRTLLFFSIFFFLGFASLHDPLLLLGLTLGTGISIANFRLLARDIRRLFSIKREKVPGFVRGRVLARYGLIGLVLYICRHFGVPCFLSACCGVFMVKFAILSLIFFEGWDKKVG